ncbi:hypothetical protein KXV58_002622 [Aspergillus fumigatus]|nr:hypothetical protein KXX11_006571 [Aspergillus fumigatus]KAH1372433.1 hypothetical protein KXX50_003938 [Aspergillus fumigatus]KAH1415455.1 hypothetical protein KXX64_006153 [Aspergillus fumigatus]KAH1508334.1 hypothetical protein KXX06_008145 [Aspergillus fumigatus]KAH1558765.1 hypothetical protein KXX17_006609 [Aspergillus fumigatus]
MSTAVLPTPKEPAEYPDAPSTWDNARGHIFMCFARPSSATEPPPASYHDLEEKSEFANQSFIGGLQVCVIVRYLESPIGEYDELLWIPGAFENPWSGKQTYRATRAYVSTGVSLYNGRKNWNVPKIVSGTCQCFVRSALTKLFPNSAQSSNSLRRYPDIFHTLA